MPPDNSSDAHMFAFNGNNLAALTESVSELIKSENAERKQVASDKVVDPPAESMKHAFKSLISSLMIDDHGGTFNLERFKQVAGEPMRPYNMLLTALSSSSDISCRLFACEWLATLASVQQAPAEDTTPKTDSGSVDVSAEGSDNFFEHIKKMCHIPVRFSRVNGVCCLKSKLSASCRNILSVLGNGNSREIRLKTARRFWVKLSTFVLYWGRLTLGRTLFRPRLSNCLKC